MLQIIRPAGRFNGVVDERDVNKHLTEALDLYAHDSVHLGMIRPLR